MAKIITPVVTVFDQNEKPDYEANKKVIDFLVEGGVDGILVLGSTGEFTALIPEEKRDFLQFYAEYTAGRAELYAGTNCMEFRDTVSLSNAVYDMGYTAPLVISPFYYGIDQEKLFLYFDRLAKSLSGDLYLYNYPARSGHSIAPQTVRRLAAANANIAGLKDSVPEPNHTNLICMAVEGRRFTTYSGFDDQFMYNLSSGGNGCIGGLSNIVPEIWRDLVAAANNKDYERSMRLSYLIHKLMPVYDMDSSPSLLLKRLMIHRGVGIASTAVFPFNQIDGDIFLRAAKLLDGIISEYRAI